MPKSIYYAMDADYLKKYADHKDRIYLESVKLDSQEVKRISAEIQESRSDNRQLFSVDEYGVAQIAVTGPLENKPDPCAILFDIEMTTYSDIIRAIDKVEADDNIKKVTFIFDTPGGNVVGLFKTADKIRNMKKETTALVVGMCASAGYALASQCDIIEAENISNEIGSIGVRTELVDYSGQEAGRGIKRYILTSENAENKAPDITTEEGRDKIIARLTDLELVFHKYVAIGRDTTIENVRENFGRGSMFTSEKALEIGMIDSIESVLPGTSETSSSNNSETNMEDNMADITMSEEQLKKFGEDIASNAVSAAEKSFNAKLEERDNAFKAESERKAGFTALLTKYPEQTSMINEEMAKEGATASADFAIKVAEAETARLKAIEEQEGNQEENTGDFVKPGDDGASASDDSGNILAGALGIKIGGTK